MLVEIIIIFGMMYNHDDDSESVSSSRRCRNNSRGRGSSNCSRGSISLDWLI